MRRIVLISGRQGSGKTTLAADLQMVLQRSLYVPVTIKFAGPIYEIHDEIQRLFGLYGLKTSGIDGTLMQLIGEHVRNKYGVDTWVNMAKKEILDALSINRSVVIVDDLRYRNELHAFPRHDVCVVRLECPESIRKERAEKWRDNVNHPSEVDLDGYDKFDLVFDTSTPRKPYSNAGEVLKWLKTHL